MSAEPFPTRLQGGIWRFQVPWCVLWAVIVLVLGAAVGIADHDWTGWVWGLAVALLLVAIAIRVFQTRYVGIDPEGLTVRSFWRTRRFSWGVVADVTLTSRSFLGPATCRRSRSPTGSRAGWSAWSHDSARGPRSGSPCCGKRRSGSQRPAGDRGSWPGQADHVPRRAAP